MLKLQFSIQTSLSQYELTILRTFFHVLFSAHHLYAGLWFINFDIGNIENKKVTDLMKFADRYLTSWNFAFQLFYFLFALYCDYIDLRTHPAHEDKYKKLKKFRDVLFTSIVFPISMFVATMFWIVYVIDRELIVPAECDQYIPWWILHATHTTIVICVLMEVVLQPRSRPEDETTNLVTLNVYSVCYMAVLLGTYFNTGRWIYPIYNSMTWMQRCLFLTVIFYMNIAFYYVGWHTNDLFWRNKKEKTNKNINHIKDSQSQDCSPVESETILSANKNVLTCSK